MSSPGSTKAIIYALITNTAVATVKLGAALWTGSGSMMAESVHSFADCGNQILLFVGIRRSNMPPTKKHPMGYDREAYMWSMIVALLLFSVGGVFSAYEGWHHYVHPQAIEHVEIAIGILLFAFIMESISLRSAIKILRVEEKDVSLWQAFKDTHSSELMVVIGEDMAAILGLIIALGATILVALTGNLIYDAIGSMLIGALLISVSFFIAREVHSLLLGEADDQVRDAVQQLLENHPAIVQVYNIFAINHGNYVMLAIKAQMPDLMLVIEASAIINAIERDIRAQNPRVKWVFFEIDDKQ